ncbi:MAG: Hsp33 family molecular chaperone [Alphaproteobacteria bacterium]|nr:Hsp33 family molecular chaperone [Alphaproteobacteria bacterium]
MTCDDLQDDYVLPFSTDKSRALGRLVRLGPIADEILKRHDYPAGVSEVLGQALALTGMLGSTLKFEGNLILQTQTNGPLGFLVANFEAPGKLRGYASFDEQRRAEFEIEPRHHGRLLGDGHLALTIDPGGYMDRYQGIVSLAGNNLSEAANSYFRDSEQLPTYVRLAIARHHGGTVGDGEWHWRAGGIMVQYVSPVGGRQEADEDEGGNANWLMGEREEDWQRVSMLAATVEDHELLDPMLSSERLLYRLFHEEGVRAGEALPLQSFCRCSRERVETFISTFKGDDIAGMLDQDGKIAITCEFCNEVYRFEPADT